MKEIEVGRPILIKGMSYAPTNEQGVVFLFGRLAAKLGFQIELVQVRFPDCMARRQGKVCRIEFEYHASNYRNHPPKGADIIVCWDNDWEHRPKQFQHLEIIDLKKYTGASPRVFSVGCDEDIRGHTVDKNKTLNWSIPKSAQADDLVLMYRSHPASEIRDLWKITGPFFEDEKWGVTAWIKLVTKLEKPLTFKVLKNDPITRNLGIVRSKFQGKTDITNDWPYIHDKIVKLNPKVKKLLNDYHFD